MRDRVQKVSAPAPSQRPARKAKGKGTGPRPFLEKRREARTSDWKPELLLIETGYGEQGPRSVQARPGHAHSAPAQLIDVSKNGLGVETLLPLILDSIVSVNAQLHGRAGCIELKGTARVVECRSRDEETYRVGLAFLEVERRESPCSHEADSLPAED